jgi:hypothetical protein
MSWKLIGEYQILSESFIKKHKIAISDDNWLYKSGDEKLELVKKAKSYEIKGDFVFAYKSVDKQSRSVYMPAKYKYIVGETYESICDYNADNFDSFGLSAWTKKGALNYHPEDNLLVVRIHKDDIGCLTREYSKIRCRKFTVVEVVDRRLLK